MAITKVTRTLLSTGIDDQSNATAITIDSSENVGIGTSSIASGGANTQNVQIHNSTANSTYFKLSTSGTGATASDGFDLIMGNDGTAYLWNRENANTIFATNNTERMRIDSSGKLLIGDTASHVDDLLQIETPASGGGHGIQIRRNDSNTDQGIGRIMFGNNTDTDLATISAKTDGSSDAAALLFSTQPNSGSTTERMRIDSSGNVGIGQTSPYSHASFTSLSMGGTSGKSGLVEFKYSNDASKGVLYAQSAAVTLESIGTNLIRFGTNAAFRGAIDSKGTLFFGNGDSSLDHNTYAHAAVFSKNSTPHGTVVIEDMDVSSGIGNTVLKCYLRDQDPATFANFIAFYDGGGSVGSITHNDDGGGVTYNTTSDYRLKENVNYDWDALSLLNQLKPAKFNFIRQPTKTLQGFLAHEVKDIVPSSVQGEKDHIEPTGTITDSDGNVVHEGVYEHFCKTDEGQTWTRTGEEPVYQELDYSRLVPLLTKAIQELSDKVDNQQTIIDNLTTRIETLENA